MKGCVYMLNSEFNQIVGRNVIDLKCGESLVLEYSCFTTLKDKTKIENIIDAYLKDGYCKNLKYSYNTISGFDLLKLNIRMVFKKEKSTNLSVIECLVGEFSHLNTLISKYVNKKYINVYVVRSDDNRWNINICGKCANY